MMPLLDTLLVACVLAVTVGWSAWRFLSFSRKRTTCRCTGSSKGCPASRLNAAIQSQLAQHNQSSAA